MIPRGRSSDIPGVRGTIPGNSQLGVVGIPIPQKAAQEVLEAWYYTKHGRRVVLEAWCYTRAAGTEVIHVATTGSIPTAARGVDIQRRCHQYQGSVGDGSDWYTGIQSTQGVITSTLFILWLLS